MAAGLQADCRPDGAGRAEPAGLHTVCAGDCVQKPR